MMTELKKAFWEMCWKLFFIFLILGAFIGYLTAAAIVLVTAIILIIVGLSV